MTEAAVHPSLFRDVYVSLGEPSTNSGRLDRAAVPQALHQLAVAGRRIHGGRRLPGRVRPALPDGAQARRAPASPVPRRELRHETLAAPVIFLVLVGFFAKGLFLNPREVPSPFIGKPAPAFTLPWWATRTHLQPGRHEGPGLAAQCLGAVVRLLPPGARLADATGERRSRPHRRPQLERQGPRGRRPARPNRHPYVAVPDDLDGRVGIDYGVTGTPETYLIDRTASCG
jgi:cytochrome c biogenesis protein CcmG, thiol:disulfide interchange protein DsbE